MYYRTSRDNVIDVFNLFITPVVDNGRTRYSVGVTPASPVYACRNNRLLIDSFIASYYHFADGLLLFVAMETGDDMPALNRLARCSDAVRLWFLRNYVQLNADKSDVMTLGTAVQLRSVAAVTTVDVAGSTLPVKPEMKLLGVDEQVAARTEQPRQGSLQVQRSDGRSTFTQTPALATDP